MPKFEIRKAIKEDIESMAELDKICFTLPWSLGDFDSEITKNEMAFYLVCLVDTRLIGYAGLWVIKPEGHITNVAVHPDYQGQGIGAQLVSELIRLSYKRFDLSDFTLEVRVSNHKAIRMYERFGFSEAGRRKAYYADTKEDALIMWRSQQATPLSSNRVK
ncbi:ribosomal-protein-alanine acetyltransferase [Clostridia bacterium]|nr:ribosomal-protein-alanine acetyltransferase [Clostridia bacterium]